MPTSPGKDRGRGIGNPVAGFPTGQDSKPHMGEAALCTQVAWSSYATMKLLRTHPFSKADACLRSYRSYLCVGSLHLVSTSSPTLPSAGRNAGREGC